MVLCFIFLPAPVLAQEFTTQDAQQRLNCFDYSLGRDNAACDAAGNITGNVTNSQSAIFDVLDDIIDRLPFYLTIIAFFALLYSGGMYIFAMGDATKMETAKKNITWAVIGVVAMAMISLIITIAHSVSTAPDYIDNIDKIRGITTK